MKITSDQVQAYLARINDSGVLGRGARRPDMLKYILEAEAADEGGLIKAYSIGVDVFDKPKDFDPTTDSTVRVEMGRLRKAIALFEAGDMADTDIRVEIPVGTYRPEVSLRHPVSTTGGVADHGPGVETAANGAAVPDTRKGAMRGLLAAAVLGAAVILAGAWFVTTQDARTAEHGPPIHLTVEDFGGDRMGREVAVLVKDSFQNNMVVSIRQLDHGHLDEGDFVLSGNVTDLNDVYWVSAELTNRGTGEVVWNHVFELDETMNLQAEIDGKLNGELKTRLIGAAKTLLEERDIETLTPEQLFILATWVSGPAVSSYDWETERVTLMKLALERDPDYGPAHSVLADKYGFLANVHPDWDRAENLRLAKFHADRAAELSPLDASALFNVAQSYWHLGYHRDSQRVFRRVTELDRGNSLARFFARVVPYWCADVPDDVMQWALAFDRSLSSDDPIRWIVLTWIGTMHTNRGEYNLALKAATDAAQIFQVGYTYMLHAMLLNKVGQPDAARNIFEWQLTPWPGISVEHYATSSIPRLCREQAEPERFIRDYQELNQAIKGSHTALMD